MSTALNQGLIESKFSRQCTLMRSRMRSFVPYRPFIPVWFIHFSNLILRILVILLLFLRRGAMVALGLILTGAHPLIEMAFSTDWSLDLGSPTDADLYRRWPLEKLSSMGLMG
nr:hypothetical protein HmN_000248000 [Hymenolepis microstoma]